MLMITPLVDPNRTLSQIFPFYEVKLIGWKITKLEANNITESTYVKCYIDENKYLLLESFVDYKKDYWVLDIEIRRLLSKTSQQKAGWDICCKWKDHSTSWEKASNLKKLHPIQVAKYAIVHGIEHEPAFS